MKISYILSLQLSFIGLIVLNYLGFSIPLLQQLIGFIFLTLIPGYIIVKLLRINISDTLDIILYSVGLSLFFLMFLGFCMNLLYILSGIKLLSFIPLAIVINLLIIISYIFYPSKNTKSIQLNNIPYKTILFLTLLPIISILGASLVNNVNTNVLLLILIILISLFILISSIIDINKNIYPYAIFAIAISLLYHNSLITQYLIGTDVYIEYYYSKLVLLYGFWDFNLFGNINAMLSITMIAPIYSMLCNIDLSYVYKLIYPFLFSLVPLGLFQIFKKIFNAKIALYSCIFFIFLFTYYTEMISLGRQEVAELFLVLLIMVLLDNNINKMIRQLLTLIFGISVIISHYALSNILLLSLFIVYTYNFIIYIITINNYIPKLFRIKILLRRKDTRSITFTTILIFFIISILWYSLVAGSTTFNSIFSVLYNIITNMFSSFMNPDTSQGLKILTTTNLSFVHNITKYLLIFSQILIIIGFSLSVIYIKNKKNVDYYTLSLFNLLLCFTALAIPFVASSLNTTRIYHIALIILSPYFIICIIFILRILHDKFPASSLLKYKYIIISLFLIIYLLFNSGFVYEILHDSPTSISLSKGYHLYEISTPEDLKSSNWLSYYNSEKNIYADHHGRLLLWSYSSISPGRIDFITVNSTYTSSYIYLTKGNIDTNIILLSGTSTGHITSNITNKNKIYDDSSCIYL